MSETTRRPTRTRRRPRRPRAEAPNAMSKQARRPRFTTPLAEARNRAVALVLRPLRWFRPTTRFLIGFFVLVTLSTFLLARTRSVMPSAEAYQRRRGARDVAAPADITRRGARQTEARPRSRERTPPVWTFDPARAPSRRAQLPLFLTRSGSRPSARLERQPVERERALARTRRPNLAGRGRRPAAVARAVAAHHFARARSKESCGCGASGGGYVFEERDAEQWPPKCVSWTRRRRACAGQHAQARFVSLGDARESLRGRAVG